VVHVVDKHGVNVKRRTLIVIIRIDNTVPKLTYFHMIRIISDITVNVD